MSWPFKSCLALLALATAACAYVPRSVRLEAPQSAAAARTPGACLTVQPLIDARPNPQTIGVCRNGLYWPTAKVRTDDDVARWVTDYLRANVGASTGGQCELTLSGEVRHLFVDEWFNLDGRLVVALRLERAGQALDLGELEGTHSQLSQLGSQAEFEQTLQQTLSAWGQRAVPAILEAAQAPVGPAPPAL